VGCNASDSEWKKGVKPPVVATKHFICQRAIGVKPPVVATKHFICQRAISIK